MILVMVMIMVIFLTPFSTIFPWRSVLLMEETGVPEENHRSGTLTTFIT